MIYESIKSLFTFLCFNINIVDQSNGKTMEFDSIFRGSTPLSTAKYLCTIKILFQSMGQPKALEIDKNNNEQDSCYLKQAEVGGAFFRIYISEWCKVA